MVIAKFLVSLNIAEKIIKIYFQRFKHDEVYYSKSFLRIRIRNEKNYQPNFQGNKIPARKCRKEVDDVSE